jgi:hypothetical protein
MLDPEKRAAKRIETRAKWERKSKLVTDNDLLLALLRLLVYALSEESGNLKQWIASSDIFEGLDNLPRRIRTYLYVASRLLDLGTRTNKGTPGIAYPETCYKMRNGWKHKLFKSTGLPLTDSGCLQEFQRLNHRLCTDSFFRSYSKHHQIIDRMRAFMCGSPIPASYYRPPPRPNPGHAPRQSAGDISQLAQRPSDEEAIERFAEKLRTGQLARNRMSASEFDALRDCEIINDYRLVTPDPRLGDLPGTEIAAGYVPGVSAQAHDMPDTKSVLQRDLGLESAVTAMAQAARFHLAKKIGR